MLSLFNVRIYLHVCTKKLDSRRWDPQSFDLVIRLDKFRSGFLWFRWYLQVRVLAGQPTLWYEIYTCLFLYFYLPSALKWGYSEPIQEEIENETRKQSNEESMYKVVECSQTHKVCGIPCNQCLRGVDESSRTCVHGRLAVLFS